MNRPYISNEALGSWPSAYISVFLAAISACLVWEGWRLGFHEAGFFSLGMVLLVIPHFAVVSACVIAAMTCPPLARKWFDGPLRDADLIAVEEFVRKADAGDALRAFLQANNGQLRYSNVHELLDSVQAAQANRARESMNDTVLSKE